MPGVKTTPKTLEKALLENAQRLANDPAMLIPRAEGEECRKCKWPKLEKGLSKIAYFKDDPDRLVKLAGKGDQFLRAYAATISLAASGKVPFLSTAQLPIGEVSYAVRGTVDKEKLIGLQHFDDADLRLLAYWDIARRYDLHIYSTEKGLYYSTNGPRAPIDYVNEAIISLGVAWKVDSCPHQGPGAYLIVDWVSAKRALRLCQECAKGGNTVIDLSARIAAPDHTDDFRISAEVVLHCNDVKDHQCRSQEPLSLPSEVVKDYLAGKIDDVEVLNQARMQRMRELSHEGKALVLGGECYGTDKDAFLANLKGSEMERRVITSLVRDKNLVIVAESNQAGRIITDLWPEHKEEMLHMVTSADLAKAYLDRTDLSPPQLLADASRSEASVRVGRSLPQLCDLGQMGTLADSLARTYKMEGKEAMVRAVERTKRTDHRTKAVCYGFLKAAGESSRSWQFSREEIDYGTYLAQFAETLFQASGEEYSQALQTLLTAAGCEENVK